MKLIDNPISVNVLTDMRTANKQVLTSTYLHILTSTYLHTIQL